MIERRVRTKYGSIAAVNWHRDGLVGVTHLTDSPDGSLKLAGLSNVYREDEVEFLTGEEPSTFEDVRSLSDHELREQLLALRRHRRERPKIERRDPVAELRQQVARLTPQEKETLRRLLKGGAEGGTVQD